MCRRPIDAFAARGDSGLTLAGVDSALASEPYDAFAVERARHERASREVLVAVVLPRAAKVFSDAAAARPVGFEPRPALALVGPREVGADGVGGADGGVHVALVYVWGKAT